VPEDKKITSDEDWKEQARREKEQLSAKLDEEAVEDKPRTEGEGGGGEQLSSMPEADFMSFVMGLAAQTAIYLGQIKSPDGKDITPDLPAAKYHIDLLGILVEKTKGNLTPEEERGLQSILADLRMRYVDAAGGAGGQTDAPASGD